MSSFAAVQESPKRIRRNDLTYQVFDNLQLDGEDLTGLPLMNRKQILKALLAVRFSDHVQGRARHSTPMPADQDLRASSASSRVRRIGHGGRRNGTK